VVVGAEKVPREVYDLVDFNVAVGNQPHSEVAALAIFLDRITLGESLQREPVGRLRIRPNPRGKSVIDSRTQTNNLNRTGSNEDLSGQRLSPWWCSQPAP